MIYEGSLFKIQYLHLNQKSSIYYSYLGIDVAKAKIDCCLILENSASKKTKNFSNTPKGFEQLHTWLKQHAATSTQTIILMEATSIYHELLAKYLFDARI